MKFVKENFGCVKETLVNVHGDLDGCRKANSYGYFLKNHSKNRPCELPLHPSQQYCSRIQKGMIRMSLDIIVDPSTRDKRACDTLA